VARRAFTDGNHNSPFSRYDERMMDLLAAVQGCTFDDFLFKPQFSVMERRDPKTIDLSSRFSEHLTLKHPIVSANMDTITRSAMAIVQAEEGGLGIIDRGFRGGDIAAQVREVEIVKRTQHGVIPDPYTISVDASLAEASKMMEKSGVGTLVVVDGSRKLKGLLTTRDARFVSGRCDAACSVPRTVTRAGSGVHPRRRACGSNTRIDSHAQKDPCFEPAPQRPLKRPITLVPGVQFCNSQCYGRQCRVELQNCTPGTASILRSSLCGFGPLRRRD